MRWLLSIIFLIMMTSPANALFRGLWEASLIYSDETSITVGWDVTTSTCPTGKYCGYDLEFRHLENPTYIDAYKVPGYAVVQKVITYKKSGHYKLFIRAISCDNSALTLNCLVSPWADSVANGMIVIGVPTPIARPWLLYWRLPVPTGGVIE